MEYGQKDENFRNKPFPSPEKIECIHVTKVYNEGLFTQVEEVLMEFLDVEGSLPELVAQCGPVRVLDHSCTVIKEGLVKVKATLEAACSLDGVEESEEFTIEKVLRLQRAGDKGLDVQCEIFPKCLSCHVTGEEEGEEEMMIAVTACIGIMILVKVVATVQLLVPTFGFCPEPPEGEEVQSECPAFSPPWPPYPPQE